MTSVDRRRPPQPGESRAFRFPSFQRTRLDNGLAVLLAARREVPLVEALLQLPAGGDRNPQDRSGLAALTASLVDEGTATRSGPEIAATLERLGGSLTTRTDWNAALVDVSLHARDLGTGLELAADVARRPSFPAVEFERLQLQTRVELLRRRDQPAVLAEEALSRALYAGTPYGYLLLGDDDANQRIVRDDVLAFHAAHYRPAPAALVMAGDFEPAAALERVQAVFGDWPAAAAPVPTAIEPAAGGRRVVIVDRPGAAQTELRLAQPGVPRTHPDRTRLGLLNALLGGKFTSRLNLNLRERHGFTYGANSRFVDRRWRGPFVISAAVANGVAGAAVREALSEVERLREEPVPAEELAETKSYLLGVFPYTLQTNSDVLSRLGELALWDLPDDHYERALARIAATSADDLLGLARAHLRPAEAVIVAAGPAAELTSQLEAFGGVEVVAL